MEAYYSPWGFQEVQVPRFPDIQYTKVVRLSALHIGRLYPQQIPLVLISVGGSVDPRATVRPKGLSKWKILVTPSGIEPATSRLEVQCLNQLRQRVPQQWNLNVFATTTSHPQILAKFRYHKTFLQLETWEPEMQDYIVLTTFSWIGTTQWKVMQSALLAKWFSVTAL
jgi:hypothetical protein